MTFLWGQVLPQCRSCRLTRLCFAEGRGGGGDFWKRRQSRLSRRLSLPFRSDFSAACDAVCWHCTHTKTSFKIKVNPECLLWHKGIGGVSGALGCGFNPRPDSGLKIQHCYGCILGRDCSLDLIPSLGTPSATGSQKKKKKNQS